MPHEWTMQWIWNKVGLTGRAVHWKKNDQAEEIVPGWCNKDENVCKDCAALIEEIMGSFSRKDSGNFPYIRFEDFDEPAIADCGFCRFLYDLGMQEAYENIQPRTWQTREVFAVTALHEYFSATGTRQAEKRHHWSPV
ncbi:hypothetical protein NX059_008097 [Plenodomus lindquistii]|nr:hypothetical protein NX059_008097 [Plenodomus lindquistii]